MWHHFDHPRLLHAGDRLSAIQLTSLNGAGYRLAPSGHPQLINIFATWCGPCRDEMPDLTAAAQQLTARGVQVIGIDQDESGAQVTRFAREFGITFPLYIDSDGITHAALGARLIPTTIYVDTDGRIKWIHPGPLSHRDLLTLATMETNAG